VPVGFRWGSGGVPGQLLRDVDVWVRGTYVIRRRLSPDVDIMHVNTPPTGGSGPWFCRHRVVRTSAATLITRGL